MHYHIATSKYPHLEEEQKWFESNGVKTPNYPMKNTLEML